MTVKLNHYLTIINSRKEDYNKFVLKKFIPGVNQLGLHTVAGWCVLVGAYSEIVLECVASDLDRLEQALIDPRYKTLKSELLNSVKNYKTKVLAETGRFNSYSTDISEDSVKFNQTWNLIGEKKEAYGQFTRDVYFPLMEELGSVVAGEWEVLIGDSPSIICEGRVKDVDTLIRNLQGKKFREAKTTLKEYIEDYQSRILTFHIQKVKGYKSASYNLISD
jgi:hypothetical protein